MKTLNLVRLGYFTQSSDEIVTLASNQIVKDLRSEPNDTFLKRKIGSTTGLESRFGASNDYICKSSLPQPEILGNSKNLPDRRRG